MTGSLNWKTNRWFYVAVVFLLINSYAVLRLTHPTPRAAFTLRVQTFSPGEDQSVAADDVLKWTFSTNVAGASVTDRWTPNGPVSFQPATAGMFCWTAPNELWFQPRERWRGCTKYTALLDDDLRSLAGQPLTAPRRFRFHTAPLALREVRLAEFNRDREATVRLEFNEPVAAKEIESNATLKSADGKELSFQTLGQRDSAVLLLRTERLPDDDDHLVVLVHRGLHSTSGSSGLEAGVSETVSFSQMLALTRLEPVSKPFEDGELRVSFTTGVDVPAAVRSLEVQPKVDFTVQEPDYNCTCRLIGAFQPGASYSVTFRKGLKGTNGQTLAADVTRQVYFPDRPASVGFRTSGHYLSPHGNLLVPVTTVNVREFTASVQRVYPNNLVEFVRREPRLGGRSWWYNSNSHYHDVGHAAGQRPYRVASRPNDPFETRLDLREFLGDTPSGALHIVVNPDKGDSVDYLVLVTDIGLTVKRSGHDLLVWANSIHTLEPVADADVRVYSRTNQELARGKTDADGVARLQLSDANDEQPFLVTATRQGDLSFLALDGSLVNVAGELSGRPYLERGYEAFAFTDRGVYRPGETVHLKAIVRAKDVSVPSRFPVQLHVMRPDGNRDRMMTGMLTEFGTAEFTIELADYAMTGSYSMQIRIPGTESSIGSVAVAVEEFVPPQIAVSVETDRARVSPGGPLAFEVSARHLFGRAAAGNIVNARVAFLPEPFTPTNWPGYAFTDTEKTFSGEPQELGRTTLDADGKAQFTVQPDPAWRPPSALQAFISATVLEHSGRAVSAVATRWVDAYPFYVGLKLAESERPLWTGESRELLIAAVKPDGTADTRVSRLQFAMSQVSWTTVLTRDPQGCYSYRSERRLTTVATQEVRLSNGKGTSSFVPKQSGEYLISVRDPVSDSSASLTLTVSSREQESLPWSLEHPERVELQFDRASYAAGDEARLMIKAPFPGRALLTIESDRVLEHRVLTLGKNTATVTLPVRAEYRPNVYCSLSLIRPVVAAEKWAGHRAVGAVPILVRSPERRLEVKLAAPAEMRPQQRLPVGIVVTDSGGRAVKAEVVIAAVDEGICMLTDFRTPDPLGFFEARRGLGVECFDLYSLLMPELDGAIRNGPSAPGGDKAAMLKKRLNPIKALRFKPVALWSSTVVTGEDGRATVAFDVPEFSGELRLMAVAVGAQQFGSQQQSVRVKRPLIVLSSLPRFLAPGDTCRAPVQIFNETGSNGEVRVTLATTGPVAGASEKTIAMRAGEQRDLEFDLIARNEVGAGTARLRAVLGSETYEESFELAVRPAFARQIESRVGSVAAGGAVELPMPAQWLANTAEQELWCSGLPSVQLGESLDYLLHYPYGCVEQTTSSAFPLLYLADLAAQLRPGSLGREETAHFVQAGIHRLLSMQLASGGFAMWPHSSDEYEWGSAYATHFLVEAAHAGYDVPQDRLDAACEYLQRQLSKPIPSAGDIEARTWRDSQSVRSYACLVLALAGKPENGRVARLQELRARLDFSAQVNVAAALAAAHQRREATAMLASIGLDGSRFDARDQGGCLNSRMRDQAVLLSAWLELDPDNPLVPELVRRLETSRGRGGWYTTQEHAMALLALGKYCKRAAVSRKPFAATVSWRDGTEPLASNQEKELHLNAGTLGSGKARIANQGPGTVYFYWRSEGVPANGRVRELDNGLQARRRLLQLNGQPLDTRLVRQGDLIIVEITLDPLGRNLDNVVIEDLLPAGLEIENPNLKTAELVAWLDKDKPTLPLRHADLRDDRFLAFTSGFGGRLSYYYAARAVTVGKYVYPALSASCMYDPDVHSVHGQTTFEVK